MHLFPSEKYIYIYFMLAYEKLCYIKELYSYFINHSVVIWFSFHPHYDWYSHAHSAELHHTQKQIYHKIWILTKNKNGSTWLWVNKASWEVCFPYDIKINIQHEMMSNQQQTSISRKNDVILNLLYCQLKI